jgi:hypothetical protein
MDNVVIIALISLLGAVWLGLHLQSKLKSKTSIKPNFKDKPTKPKSAFHGITIQPGSRACQNVAALAKKRFLASEVSCLPTHGCTNPECSCHYVHHPDRRSGEDRRYPSISMQHIYSDNEHRTINKQDRRKSHFA